MFSFRAVKRLRRKPRRVSGRIFIDLGTTGEAIDDSRPRLFDENAVFVNELRVTGYIEELRDHRGRARE